MKIKSAHLRKALDHLRYQASMKEDQAFEISIREEDIGNGRIGDSVIITYTSTYEPPQYDSLKTSSTKEFTLEVFADHENRSPRFTVVESRELEFKKD